MIQLNLTAETWINTTKYSNSHFLLLIIAYLSHRHPVYECEWWSRVRVSCDCAHTCACYWISRQVQLDQDRELVQFSALITNFFHSFTYESISSPNVCNTPTYLPMTKSITICSYDPLREGMSRPDDFSTSQGDHGPAYAIILHAHQTTSHHTIPHYTKIRHHTKIRHITWVDPSFYAHLQVS